MAKCKGPADQNIRLRLAPKLSQVRFWVRIGVSQTSGSRYENGRAIPKPTETLVNLVYGKNPEKLLKKLRMAEKE